MSVPDGARCGLHPSALAELTCRKCGDYVCAACRRYRECSDCAAAAPSAFAPLQRQRYWRLVLPPVALFLFATAAVGLVSALDAPPRLALYSTGFALLAMLAAVVSFVFLQWRWLPGSVVVSARAQKRHRTLREEVDAGEVSVIGELESLALDSMPHPKAQARLLITLARAQMATGDLGAARALLAAIARSGWLRGSREFDDLAAKLAVAE